MRLSASLSLLLALGMGAAPRSTFADDARTDRMDAGLWSDAAAAVSRGLTFLASAQLPDGGWPGFERSDPAITSLVVLCFMQHPDYGPTHTIVTRGLDLVLRHAQPDGGIYLPDAGLHNYYTSVALMALSKSDHPRHKEAADRARNFLTRLQWDESEDYEPSHVFYGGAGYGSGKRPDLSNTQLMLEAIRDSGLSPEHPVYKKALVFVSRCQMLPGANDQPFAAHGDGGFIYSPANGGESKAGEESVDGHTRLRSYGSMTYAGFKSMLYADVNRNDPRVRAAFDWIRKHYTLDHNPNMPHEQSEQGLFYFYHVFARAMHAWGADEISDPAGVKHNWRDDLVRALKVRQRGDGSWFNDADRWYESNPHLVTAYAVLALQTTLE